MSHGDVWLDLLYDYVDVHILTPKEYGAGGVFSCIIQAYITYGERVTF